MENTLFLYFPGTALCGAVKILWSKNRSRLADGIQHGFIFGIYERTYATFTQPIIWRLYLIPHLDPSFNLNKFDHEKRKKKKSLGHREAILCKRPGLMSDPNCSQHSRSVTKLQEGSLSAPTTKTWLLIWVPITYLEQDSLQTVM
ncbi:hypothetical protein AVEN_154642-1 [Araneus ventricosus]|uniref:Uncharacterized protein n=1 Tax=Araneus ventricosus TaxID=182803 RepID=A0A4Y2JN06_ARAVE|nr:hypothetical protein AVEN_154642-1 [Araneus ventricosus]